MDSAGEKASEFDRRASMRASVRLSVHGEDDDYDLHASTIADGFRRPDDVASSSSSQFSSDPSTTASTLHVPDSPPTQRAASSRPSSIAKPPEPSSDSISLRSESSPDSATDSSLSRVSSVSTTDSPSIRVESPYPGPQGPAHPYAMYPQRALSSATTSTAPVADGMYHGPRGPAHPYGLYNQTTAPGEGTRGSGIPVGFNGQDTYRRQIGPDGEEAGVLVGPLGHTEELPPYTRYPEEAYARKPGPPTDEEATISSAATALSPPAHTQATAPASASTTTSVGATVVASISPAQSIPGAGGIGLATRDPEYASTDDLDSPRSRLSTRSFTSDASQHEINTAARTVTEKPSSQGKWQKRAKKRMWGIVPYWAICLLAVALAVMGIILGAVIGTFLAGHKRPTTRQDDASPQTLPSANMDAQPLKSVPPDLPPLDTGAYGLPPLIASQAPSTCFNVTTQAQAWSCNIPFAVYFVEITKLPDQPATSEYALKLTTPYNNTGSVFTRYSWGTQPPLIPEPMKLVLVNDTFEPGRGPAWWMQMTYNKTVILTEDKFPGPNTVVAKRGWGSGGGGGGGGGGSGINGIGGGGLGGSGNSGGPGGGDFKRKGMGLFGAQNGDKPWICSWPGTILEVFIYPAQNNSFKPFPTPSGGPSPSGGYPTGFPSGFPTGFPGGGYPGGRQGALTASSSTSAPLTSSTASGSVNTASTTTSGTSSAPSPSSSFFPFGDNDDWKPPNPPPPYPKVIKFEERRVPGSGSTTASCRQVEIINDGQDYKPVLDANNQPVEVIIVENKREAPAALTTSTDPDRKRWLYGNDLVYRDISTDQLSDCGCIWWFT